MSTLAMKLFRDRLVNDATLRGLLNATATGSATVFPTFMERSATYAQVIYSITEGPSDPGMSATNGLITFNIEIEQTSSANPHTTYSNIQTRMEQLLDDQNLTGTDVSGTASYAFRVAREGAIPAIFNPERKTYSKIINFSYKQIDR